MARARPYDNIVLILMGQFDYVVTELFYCVAYMARIKEPTL